MKTASMILGLIAAIIGAPVALISGLFGAATSVAGSALHGATAQAAANAAVHSAHTYLMLGLIGSGIAFVSAFLVRRPGNVGASGLALALALSILSAFSLNPLTFVVAALLLLATVFGFLGKSKNAPATARSAVSLAA